MKSLSLAAGRGETFVRDLLRKGSSPSIDNLERLAQALGLSVAELVSDEKPFQSIPIIGAASAGEHWLPFDDDIEMLEMRADDGDPVAIEVRGDSMSPAYRSGDIIVGTRRFGSQMDAVVGRDCIVHTETGERFVKFIKRAARYGHYTLKSYNPTFDDIENVRLEWAAPIVWVYRPS